MHAGRKLVLLLALVLVSCVPNSRRNTDPFSMGGERRGGVTTYRIQLEVLCTGCSVTWQVGTAQGTEQVNPGSSRWSRRITRAPIQRETVRILAAPGEEAVQAARIWVNGEVVAERRCDCDDFRRTAPSAFAEMHVETVIGR